MFQFNIHHHCDHNSQLLIQQLQDNNHKSAYISQKGMASIVMVSQTYVSTNKSEDNRVTHRINRVVKKILFVLNKTALVSSECI